MRNIWTVARHTLSQCLRMKIAVAFIILLALGLAVMPLLLKGDGTLAGRIRTLLSYGMGMTALLGSLVTVFVSTSLVTGDVRTKQIFSVATKPVSRWQYVIGRWMGVVLMDLLLLAVAGTAVYATAQHLRRSAAISPQDRRAVEAEVFAARRRISPVPFDIQIELMDRITRLEADNRLEGAIEAMMPRFENDHERAKQEVLRQIGREISEQKQSAPPTKSLSWDFEGIELGHMPVVSAPGRVMAVLGNNAYRIRVSSEDLVGQLVPSGPVKINGIDARSLRLERTYIEVQFADEDARRRQVAELAKDSPVEVTADPSIQVTYKVNPVRAESSDEVQSYWLVSNPTTGQRYQEFRKDPPRLKVTLTVPARLVDQKGRLKVTYINVPDPSRPSPTVTVLAQDVAVLAPLGNFTPNYIRGLGLVALQLGFLAAVGLTAGTFLSFPVACLLALAVLPFGMAQGFISGAVHTSQSVGSPLQYPGGAAIFVMRLLMPDFGATSAGSYLTDGMLISWSHLGRTALVTMVLRGLALLAVGCLIFHHRELARVQV